MWKQALHYWCILYKAFLSFWSVMTEIGIDILNNIMTKDETCIPQTMFQSKECYHSKSVVINKIQVNSINSKDHDYNLQGQETSKNEFLLCGNTDTCEILTKLRWAIKNHWHSLHTGSICLLRENTWLDNTVLTSLLLNKFG